MNKLRIGLTMRVTDTPEYKEDRDTLAQNWQSFMKRVLPGAIWLPLPNIGEEIKNFIESWNLNGFILTGGNDIFEHPVRDKTEYTILEYSLNRNYPVFGVCRGLQLMAHYFKYRVTHCPDDSHINNRHEIRVIKSFSGWDKTSIMVNSYHTNCIPCIEEKSGSLLPFAFDSGGFMEGAYHITKPVLGVMWHPEREQTVSKFDLQMIRNFFKTKERDSFKNLVF